MPIKPAFKFVEGLKTVRIETPVLKKAAPVFEQAINAGIEQALSAATRHVNASMCFEVNPAYLEYLRTRMPDTAERHFLAKAREILVLGASDIESWLSFEFRLLRESGYRIGKTDVEVNLHRNIDARVREWLEIHVKLEFEPT